MLKPVCIATAERSSGLPSAGTGMPFYTVNQTATG
jgi:hypothetical protein